MDPIKVSTIALEDGNWLAFDPANPAEMTHGASESAATVAHLLHSGRIERTRIREPKAQEPVVVELAPARNEGLTLRQAQEHAKIGAKITREGCENSWYLMSIASFWPSWGLFRLDANGELITSTQADPNPSRWPEKAPRHHQETSEHVYAKDWKVLE